MRDGGENHSISQSVTGQTGVYRPHGQLETSTSDTSRGEKGTKV